MAEKLYLSSPNRSRAVRTIEVEGFALPLEFPKGSSTYLEFLDLPTALLVTMQYNPIYSMANFYIVNALGQNLANSESYPILRL